MAKSPNTTTAPTGNIAPFGLRMLPELREQVEAAAKASGRSMNAEVVARLHESLNRVAADPGQVQVLQEEVKQQRELAKQFKDVADFLDGMRMLMASLLNDALALVPEEAKPQGIEQQFAERMMEKDRLGAAYSLLRLADGSDPAFVLTLKNLVSYLENHVQEMPRNDLV